jgi:hypothetical protein
LRKIGKRPKPHKRIAPKELQGQKRPRKRRQVSSSGAAEDQTVTTITIDGDVDSHQLEALKLELRALAHSCGLEVSGIEIETSMRD